MIPRPKQPVISELPVTSTSESVYCAEPIARPPLPSPVVPRILTESSMDEPPLMYTL